MARVRSSGNRTTELRMIQLLKEHGVTGWRRASGLIGKPDFVWREQRVVLFVDGCFWHGHDCDRNLRPAKNKKFWESKIKINHHRDRFVVNTLRSHGWHVVRLWECMLVKQPARCIASLMRVLTATPR